MPRITMTLSRLALAGAFALACGQAMGQGGFAGIADPESLDTLSGQSVGGGGTGQLALDRARGLQAGDPFGGGATTDPFGGPSDGFGAPGDPFAAGPGGAPQQVDFGFNDEFGPATGIADPGGAGATGLAVPTFKAIYGTRYTCRITGQILDDARQVSILASAKESYYDDGETAGDAEANDLTFTNVQFDESLISPEAHLVKTRLIRALQWAENRPAHEFFNVVVASTDPLANVPSVLDLEAERDDKISVWAKRFLRDYRVDPDAPDGVWEFSQSFMPPPPRVPTLDLPSTFLPARNAIEAGVELDDDLATNGGATGGPVPAGAQQAVGNAFSTDTIQDNPGASSGYF
jgi:hypothetical protein